MSKDTSRWIAISVDMFEHPVVGAHLPPPKPADPSRHSWPPMIAWQWMLVRAAFKAHTFMVKGNLIRLARGQQVLSSRFLSDNANWNRKAARVFLDRLRRFGMVQLSTATREGQLALDFASLKEGPGRGPATAIVTICNYDKYQHKLHIKGPSLGPSKGPAGAQVSTKDKITKEDNTISVAAKRPRRAAAEDDALRILIHEAARAAMPEGVGDRLDGMAIPKTWLTDGCDLQLDILPTIRSLSARLRDQGTTFSTWAYFGSAIRDARKERTSGKAAEARAALDRVFERKEGA